MRIDTGSVDPALMVLRDPNGREAGRDPAGSAAATRGAEEHVVVPACSPPGPAEVAEQIGVALDLADGGDRAQARDRLTTMWDALGPGSATALSRALLAHHLGWLQEDPEEELWWNLRALQAVELATDAQSVAWGMPIPARGLFPLLHLRLAQCYHRAGQFRAARRHLHHGQTWIGLLSHDSHGDRVRAGLHQLAEQLDLYTPPSGTHRAR